MSNQDITSTAIKELLNKGVKTSEILKYLVKNKIDEFYELQKWSEDDYATYDALLSQLIDLNKDKAAKTTDKGKALEDIVRFIIKKTYFFDLYYNIPTSTNEIDQIIKLSDKGKQALIDLELSKDILPVEEEIFLSECKNYATNLGVAWVGKFYGLLKTCDCKFGILFSVKGLSGEEAEWKDAHGLIKVFRLIEKYQNNNDFYIIEFNLEDFQKIGNRDKPSYFIDIIKAKKESTKIGTSYEKILDQCKEEIEIKVVEEVAKLRNQ